MQCALIEHQLCASPRSEHWSYRGVQTPFTVWRSFVAGGGEGTEASVNALLCCVSHVINSQLLIQLAPRRVCSCFLSFPSKKINKLLIMSLIKTKSELFITLL